MSEVRLTLAQISLVREEMARGEFATAANLVKYAFAQTPNIRTHDDGKRVLREFYNALIDCGNYVHAAAMVLAPPLFHPEMASVRDVMEAADQQSLLLCMGASSMGKTYNLVIFNYLDWLRDPEFTSVKLMSQTAQHLETNVWPHMLHVHEACLLKPEKEVEIAVTDMWMGLKGGSRMFGFSGLAFRQSQMSSGAFKGFKPRQLRTQKDPNYAALGAMSRLRVLLDEAQQIPAGVWQDLESIKASISGKRVKIMAAFNPEDVSQAVVQLAEPQGGWHTDQQETLYKYESRNGWWVVRLDATRCENVIERREIFAGVITYEAYLETLKGGGDLSPRYWCVDEQTQALTRRGWKGYADILPSDLIYSVNPNTGLAGWMPIESVFKKHYDGNLISMEGQNLSALVTDNHRWAISHKQRLETGKQSLNFRETKDLKKHDNIPLVRDGIHPEDGPSDDYAALLGWVASDGNIETGNNNVYVSQSFLANADKCEIIHSLFTRMGISPRVFDSKYGIRVFNFNGHWAKKVREDLPNKRLTIDTIERFPLSGKKAMLQALVLGDGGVQGGGTRYICTSDEEQASIYAALAARCGLSTTTHKRTVPGGYVQKNGRTMQDHVMFYVNIKRAKHIRNQYIEHKAQSYNGIVWCPRTPNGTFLARRNGIVYFTGNTFARGFPPLQSSMYTVVPPDWASSQRGEALYVGKVENIAAVDLAYQGADKAVIGVGRWGLAYGWRNQQGRTIEFMSRLNPKLRSPRHVLTVDQFFPIPKALDAVAVTQEIMGKCKMMNISPDWVAMDCTGNAMATYSYAVSFWGKILGINWANKATDLKVLTDDLAPASERFDGIPSEMWFAFKHWLDPNVCAVLINPIIQSQEFYTQMTGRRYKNTRSGRLHIESKEEFRARNGGKSPDEVDVVVMMEHLVRMRGGVIPGMMEQKVPVVGGPGQAHKPSTESNERYEPLETEAEPLEIGEEVRGGLDLGHDED